MLTPKIIDLEPNKCLLNSNFNGYKLSLKELPTLKKNLEPSSVVRASPKPDQYSFLHAKLYGLHNHLIGETIDGTDIIYFISKSWDVMKSAVESFEEFVSVWRIPMQKEHSPGDYNVTLKFATDNLAVIGDGIGKLYIANTGCRLNNSSWKCMFAEDVLGPEKPFIILDVVHKETSEPQKQELHCLLYSIVQEDVNKHPQSALHWITLTIGTNEVWGQTALREMQAKGDIYYAYIEPTCQAVYIASDNSFRFTIDSEYSITNKHCVYTWNQCNENITIQLNLPNDDYDKNNLNVNNGPTEISIKYNEFTLLESKLYRQTEPALMKWYVENNTLIITLHKLDGECSWPYLCMPQDAEVEEISKDVSHFVSSDGENVLTTGTTFSTQQMDECDYEEDKCIVFERLTCDSHEVTHRGHINSHKILLTAKLSDYPPAIALRHDVDACLWQPCFISNEWSLKHEGTLNAFAYVQASKQQRKFSVCASNLSYAVVCESRRHIFIYRQQNPVTSGELRHRNTGRKVCTIAEQQIITLTDDEILGIHSTIQNLFLLTENCMYVLKMQ